MVLLIFSFIGCQEKTSKNEIQPHLYNGLALGTDYQLQFFLDDTLDIQPQIDSIFKELNQSMSTYIEDSDISRLNQGDTTIEVDLLFRKMFLRSKEIYKITNGYFDPTVGDIVNLYGLGSKNLNVKADSSSVDSLMVYVGLDKVSITDGNLIVRKYPQTVLDFNGIAKGYGVDLLGELLEKNGVENYLAEIGGEIRTKGKNLKSGKTWRLGIDDPRTETNPGELQGIVELKDQSLATSGNYRKFQYDSVSGEKYVHIIDPKSGYTMKGSMLSVSVIADDCATADAYATAFMAMGVKEAKNIAQNQKEVEVYFIYDENGEMNTYLSKGFEQAMVE